MGTSASTNKFEDDSYKLQKQNEVIKNLRLYNINKRNMTKKLEVSLEHIRQLIYSTLDFDELMKRIIMEASKAIGCETAAISFCQGEKWVVGYSYGFPNDIIGMCMDDKEEQHAVLAAQTKKPVVIGDAFNDERVNQEHMRKWDIRSVIIVPLIVENKVIGVIFFNYYKRVHNFHNAVVEFVKSLALSVSISLHNVKLYERAITELAEREKAEKIIHKQNELLNRQTDMLNLSNEAIFAWELDGAVIYWNKGSEQMFGYSSEEAMGCVGHDLIKTIYPGYLDNIISILVRDGVWSGEIEHIGKDGKRLIIESVKQVIHDKFGHQIILETNRDITERKNAEDEIIQTNNRLSVALESVGAGIWELDIKTLIQVWSPKVYEIYGISPVEPVSLEKELASIHPDDRDIVELSFKAAINNHDEFWHIEYRIINPIRGIVWINGTGKFTYDESGSPVKLIGVSIDTTIQKKQQEQLLKTEKEKNETLQRAIEIKNEFLSLISHEFKTPLTVINSAIQAMELFCKNELSGKAKGYLDKIRQNSNRQLKLVNNLLDITRINSGQFRINRRDMDIVLLTKSITESISVFAEQKSIRLLFCSTLRKRIIGIDEEKFERILLNLLSNAIKFTPKGKSVTVKVSQRIVKGKCKVCIQVKDKGIGIPPDKQELIFERFGQVDNSLSRQAEGTGIGLHLVKMLVALLDGEIALESSKGAGSTFTVLIPMTKAKETPIEQMLNEINDTRLIQATALEFSDVYL